MMFIRIIFLSFFAFFFLGCALQAFAGPSSTNFELKQYGFGAGGSDGTGLSSPNFKMFGTAGETEYGRPSSTNFKAGSGLVFELKTNVPPAPTFTNPSSNYDRLKFVINQGGNKSDITYALAISTDNFVADTRYVKSDATVGTTLTTADFKTYTNWGGAGGTYITGLTKNTTYYLKAKSRIGKFTETEWGPVANATTSDPSLTFGIDSATLSFNNLNSGNSYTDSAKTTVLTTSTNAYNGYVVNARETGALTNVNNAGVTIANYASPNSSPTSWSATGFGYTTNDSSLTGGTADRFTNGGAKFAGFTTSSPGDPVADHAGAVLTAISNEQFTITYRVTGDVTTTAGKYTTTILYMVAPEY